MRLEGSNLQAKAVERNESSKASFETAAQRNWINRYEKESSTERVIEDPKYRPVNEVFNS